MSARMQGATVHHCNSCSIYSWDQNVPFSNYVCTSLHKSPEINIMSVLPNNPLE